MMKLEDMYKWTFVTTDNVANREENSFVLRDEGCRHFYDEAIYSGDGEDSSFWNRDETAIMVKTALDAGYTPQVYSGSFCNYYYIAYLDRSSIPKDMGLKFSRETGVWLPMEADDDPNRIVALTMEFDACHAPCYICQEKAKAWLQDNKKR